MKHKAKNGREEVRKMAEKGLTQVVEAKGKKHKKDSYFRGVIRRLRKNKSAMAGLFIFLALVVLGLLAPLIAPHDPNEMNLLNAFQWPSKEHWFGTDNYGRDLFSRMLYGARYSLEIGVWVQVFGISIGVVLGSIIGYFGGKVDMILLRLVDILQALPGLLLAIIISSALGTGFINTIIALGISYIPSACRMIRAQFLSQREKEFVEGAKSINCSTTRLIFKHILPSALSPIIVQVTFGIGVTIMSAAALSYIGLGVQPPTAEWGAILVAGKDYLRQYPYLILIPGSCIAILVLGLNMFGDGLRDAMDPKLKN